MPPKNKQKSIKKQWFFDSFFDAFLNQFWDDRGPSRSLIFVLSLERRANFHKNARSKNRPKMKPISLENWCHLAPNILPETLPKIIKQIIDFSIDFEMHFGLILDAKMHSKSHQKCHRFWYRFWMGFSFQNGVQNGAKRRPHFRMVPTCSPPETRANKKNLIFYRF